MVSPQMAHQIFTDGRGMGKGEPRGFVGNGATAALTLY